MKSTSLFYTKGLIFLGLLMVSNSTCQNDSDINSNNPKEENIGQNELKKVDETILWEQNFDEAELDLNFWTFELGDGCPNLCGWGNNEAQIYTDQNHRLENGMLYITANKETQGKYTSTRINTKEKFEFKYGRIEARIKLPVGEGVWPAFWMLGSNINKVGWPKCGEIDIMEYVGKEPDHIFTSVHTLSSFGNTMNTQKTKLETIEEGFHVYGVNWTKKKIEFFIDGKLRYVYQPSNQTVATWPFNKPAYILLNLAIGGNYGGADVDDSIFPQEYVIDYIKVYQN